MSSTVSKSARKDDHQLTRQEKDDSFSTGAGRRAVEVSKPDRQKIEEKEPLQAPIGLELETRGDEAAR